MRPIAATSMVGGVVPVPKAALLLLSSTLLLLPSQCSCMPWRGCCSQIEGKSEGEFFSCSGKSLIGKLKITLASLKVSTQPGLHGGYTVSGLMRPCTEEHLCDFQSLM